MRLVVAVSGGVDSVVLLNMLVEEWRANENAKRPFWNSLKQRNNEHNPPIIVAHFDHGIRKDSAEDMRFVKKLAEKYNLQFETKREELGADASEELARERRYAFLGTVAKKHGAVVAAAHHMNDIAETIAINLKRGTGWRGLAVLSGEVYRPLLNKTKHEIITYAESSGLDWREDSTNTSDAYLRNRIRKKLSSESEELALELAALRARQVELSDEIDREAGQLLDAMGTEYSRYFFTHVDPASAVELLRAVAVRTHGCSLPRPQLQRTLLAIKTARPGTSFPFGGAVLTIGKRTFRLSVKTP